MPDLNTFFKNMHQKWKYYREEKQDLIFLNMKPSTKSKKIKLSKEFIAMCRKEQSLCNVMSPLH